MTTKRHYAHRRWALLSLCGAAVLVVGLVVLGIPSGESPARSETTTSTGGQETIPGSSEPTPDVEAGVTTSSSVGTSPDTMPSSGSAVAILVFSAPWGGDLGEVGMFGGDESRKDGPRSFWARSDGQLYVLDNVNSRVQVVSSTGSVVSSFPIEATEPIDIAVASDGTVVIDDAWGTSMFYSYSEGGSLLGRLPTPAGIMSAALSANEDAVFSLMGIDEENGVAAWVPIYSGEALQPVLLTAATAAGRARPLSRGAELDIHMAGGQVVVGLSVDQAAKFERVLSPQLASPVTAERMANGATVLSALVNDTGVAGDLTRSVWTYRDDGSVMQFDIPIPEPWINMQSDARISAQGDLYFATSTPERFSIYRVPLQ